MSTLSLEVETKAGDSEPNKVIRVPPASSECRASITEAADSAPLCAEIILKTLIYSRDNRALRFR